jgi:hypothetical protein
MLALNFNYYDCLVQLEYILLTIFFQKLFQEYFLVFFKCMFSFDDTVYLQYLHYLLVKRRHHNINLTKMHKNTSYKSELFYQYVPMQCI